MLGAQVLGYVSGVSERFTNGRTRTIMPEQKLARENGIDRARVDGFIEAMQADPETGAVNVRTHHCWDNAYAIESSVERLEMGGESVDRSHHTFRTDWPAPFGEDSGPTPGAEALMASLGACVATTYMLTAATAGIDIEALEVTVDGSVDLRGLFGFDAVLPRFSKVSVTVRVRTDADEKAIEELGRATGRTSPAYASLANPVPVDLRVERL